MAQQHKLDRSEVESQIKEMFGFVPSFFDAIPETCLQDHWGLQRDLQLGESVLDNKTKELIGLAVAAHIKCKYCTYFHTQASRLFGATDDEMREAVAMSGLTNLFSASLNGMEVDLETFRKETDRAIGYVQEKLASR